MIKLVASDLDGTLLFKGAQSLPEEIFPLIRQLKKMGILFVAASGRQSVSYTHLARLRDRQAAATVQEATEDEKKLMQEEAAFVTKFEESMDLSLIHI